ncbi:rhodanese-like domain-containing protein [Caenispirillum salinarum]|uniref:rhodanese-like domain-containing protein n=1 Tax=Caenispirillum salinarum TaxID=859058 RepID=UPI00384B562E
MMVLRRTAAALLLLGASLLGPAVAWEARAAGAPEAGVTPSAHAWADVGPEAFAKLAADGVTVIDVRTPEEWRETGIIPGAKTIMAFDENGPVRTFPEALLAAAPPDAPVAIYCRSGNRSAAVASFAAKRLGYPQVYNLEPGIKGWVREGRPMTEWTE